MHQGKQSLGAMTAAAALLIGLTLAAPLSGQISTGTITGTVTDPQGAAMANVAVTVVHTDTNFESRTVTNSEGLYRVQSLQPGPYRVTFESPGFKRVVQSGLDLRTGDVLPVNVRMEIGQLTDSVQISAQGTLLETET
ncbi:MAG TPA: carboxypeptidase-like regulatory domain-containing protein, partial [Candidatus Sulfotelmatobacter sp.]